MRRIATVLVGTMVTAGSLTSLTGSAAAEPAIYTLMEQSAPATKKIAVSLSPKRLRLDREESKTAGWTVTNEGSAATRVRMFGCQPTSHVSWVVSDRGEDVTTQVRSASYLSPLLAPGESHVLYVRATAEKDAKYGRTRQCSLAAEQEGAPTTRLRVAFVIDIRRSGPQIGVSLNPNRLRLDREDWATSRLTVRNKGAAPARVWVRGCQPTRDVRWIVRDPRKDVTSKLRDATYRTPVLAPGESRTLRVIAKVSKRATYAKLRRCALTAEQVGKPATLKRVTLKVAIRRD